MTFDKDQLRKTAELQKLMRDPAAVRALIAENERLFKLLERTVEQYVPLTELEGVPGWSRVVELVEVVAQRDQLRAEVAGLRTGYEAYERVNAELKAENEALRDDANKWQIVERAMTQLQSDEQGAAIWSACSRILISVASELNSGRSVVTEEGVTNGGVEIGDWRVTVERIDAALGKGGQS